MKYYTTREVIGLLNRGDLRTFVSGDKHLKYDRYHNQIVLCSKFGKELVFSKSLDEFELWAPKDNTRRNLVVVSSLAAALTVAVAILFRRKKAQLKEA